MKTNNLETSTSVSKIRIKACLTGLYNFSYPFVDLMLIGRVQTGLSVSVKAIQSFDNIRRDKISMHIRIRDS